jgi:pimeloyl-ACP methyl ester carboxylesterase
MRPPVQKLNLPVRHTAGTVNEPRDRGRCFSPATRALIARPEAYPEQRLAEDAMSSSSHAKLSRRSAVAAAGVAIAATAMSGSAKAQVAKKSTYLLVHPAWHGGWCWKKVTPLLQARGHDVHTPTLTGLGERSHLANPNIGLETHIADIMNVLKYEDLSGVILVGHSSSGAVITGVADRGPERISHLVYVDAFVPEDGQSVWNIIPADRRPALEALVQTEGKGWLVPRFSAAPWEKFVPEVWRVTDEADLRWMLARLGPTPIGHFKDAVRRKDPAAAKLPRTYIRCTLYQHPGFDRYAETARKSSGWRYRELASYHHPAVTNPHELANLLLEPLSSP